MTNATKLLPRLEVKAFKSKKKLRKAIKKERQAVESLEGDFFCASFPDEEYCAIRSYILVKGFDGSIESLAILAHECSHAVDDWFDRMGEKMPGTETRAYAMHAAMTACLDQLLD